MSLFDEDCLVWKVGYEIGQDLLLFFVDELKLWIELFKVEIVCLEVEVVVKGVSCVVVDSFFK